MTFLKVDRILAPIPFFGPESPHQGSPVLNALQNRATPTTIAINANDPNTPKNVFRSQWGNIGEYE
jgi:hypothetical protein